MKLNANSTTALTDALTALRIAQERFNEARTFIAMESRGASPKESKHLYGISERIEALRYELALLVTR